MIPLLSLYALTQPVHACGAFACSAAQPVVQDREQIVFGFDPESDEIEMHVQISYSGPSEEFSWILPVSGPPDLFLTSSALFANLSSATTPTFSISVEEEGHCTAGKELNIGCGGLEDVNQPPDPILPPAGTAPVVSVVDQQVVGPYATVTLRAQSADELLDWLSENDYDIPANFETLLAPYIAEDAYFVALKLRKGNDIGDLTPLGLRFSADKASVPIGITSVAASPGMRIEVYALAETRTVPESYYHVQLNEAAIDPSGWNYDTVLDEAIDEAGGRAFVTEYYGDSDIVSPLWEETRYDRDAALAANDFAAWMAAIRPPFLATTPELFAVLEEIFDLSPGQGAVYWNCTGCSVAVPVDPVAWTEALETSIIDPTRAAQETLARHPKLTRLTTTLDPVEMTTDPTFVLNADMDKPFVSSDRRSTLVYECHNGRARDKANRRLVLPDGREVAVSSESTPESPIYFSALATHKAILVEQMGFEGQPVPIADFREDLQEQIDARDRTRACGCQSTGRATWLVPLGTVVILARRRRLAR